MCYIDGVFEIPFFIMERIMSGETKATDNRLFQLLTVIITSIIAPLTIYFVTNADKSAPTEPAPAQATVVLSANTESHTPTPLVVVVTATPEPSIATTATLTATATLEPPTPTFTVVPPTPTFTSLPPTATEAGLRDPRGNVAAGTVVVADTFSLVIDKEDIQVEGDYLRLTIRVQNTGKEAKALNYTLKAVTVKDNTGRTYAPYNGEKGKDCKKQEIDKKRSVKIEPQAEFTFQSPVRENANWFCSGDHLGALPLYIGPIRKEAKQLFVQINGIGPFTGFTVQIDL